MVLMTSWRSVLIPPTTAVLEALTRLDSSALQILMVVDQKDKLLGTLTDGDIRRGIIHGVSMDAPVERIMQRSPTTAGPGESRERLLSIMRPLKLRQLPILDGAGRVIGLCTLDDLLTEEPQRDNWVVLMAGGQGQRLRPLTESTPKPLLKVGEKPLLETILEKFLVQNFRKFFISVNYKAEMIREHFGDGSRWGVEIRYIEEDGPLGTAGPLGLLPEVPELPMVVMNGDLLTDINFGAMLDFHREQGALATMGVREYDVQVQFGVVETEHGRITAINEKPVHRFLINGGVYVLSPAALGYVPKGQALDMPQLFNGLAQNGKHTVVFPIFESWLDIGRIEDLQRARSMFAAPDADRAF